MEVRNDLPKLREEIASLIEHVGKLDSKPISLGLAVQIEMIFSYILLERLLKDVSDNYAAAGRLLNFLKTRWDKLCGTAALGPYSRETKINRACVMTAKSLSTFNTDLIVRAILNFDQTCNEKEKEILQSEKAKIEGAIQAKAIDAGSSQEENSKDNEKIYNLIYLTVFANQSIPNAMSLVPKSEPNIKTDNWGALLDGIINCVPSRATFIKILSTQVERADWRFFISKIAHFDLYHLILGINVDGLFKKHKQKPIEQQGRTEFDLELLEAANELLQKRHSKSFWVPSGGYVFKSTIEAEHGCETDEEVSALAFCLLETYRRVREKLDDYSSVASQAWSFIGAVSTKEDKVAASDLVMKFILTGKSFTRENLDSYLEAEKTAGRLKPDAYTKFITATNQGVLKALLDAMFEVQKKVARMAPRI